jgi:peptide chain release factor 1
MKEKVLELLAEIPALEEELGSPGVMSNQENFKRLASKHKYLSSLKDSWDELVQVEKNLGDDKALLKDEKDPEMIALLEDEIPKLTLSKEKLSKKVELLLVPPDPNDHRNTIVEIRAGTGGDEAAIFVGDCVRMYRLYAEKMGWVFELLSGTPSDMGGFKEYEFVLSGENVYRFMKHEAGTHRVQRVPDTEAQGRVHTSAITMAVMLEPDENEKIEIDEKELRIDTYRSQGAGGQHVNTTESAVRITHLPSGIVVHCQDERSQIKNRAKAMRLLMAKLVEERRRKQHEEMASVRAAQVGSGDRSERIRTYNFPQNRVTDHRIDLTLYCLDDVMDGNLDDLIQPLVAFFYQKNFETKK